MSQKYSVCLKAFLRGVTRLVDPRQKRDYDDYVKEAKALQKYYRSKKTTNKLQDDKWWK